MGLKKRYQSGNLASFDQVPIILTAARKMNKKPATEGITPTLNYVKTVEAYICPNGKNLQGFQRCPLSATA